MVRIAGTVLFLIWLQSFSTLYAQVRPKPCMDLLPGYQYVYDSVLAGVDPINCETNVSKQLSLLNNLGHITNAEVFFGINDQFNLATTGAGLSITHSSDLTYTFPEGKTWVLMKGELNGDKILTCKAFEFLPTKAPTVSTDLCAGSTISLEIKDERDGFKIDWGDGGTLDEIVSDESTTLAKHTYSKFYSEIKVQAFYHRQDDKKCFSDPTIIKRDIPKAVLLTSLEGLNDATEFKIKFKGGDDALEYIIESEEESTNNWLNVSVAQAGEGQVIGLNPQQKYCFRLKSENGCGESFYSENTLCNIIIDRDVQSSSEMKIHWNKPQFPMDPIVGMKLKSKISPTQIIDNPLTSPTAREFLADNLRCGQKYWYQVEANYPPALFEGNFEPIAIRTSFIPKEISEANVDAKPPYMAIASFDGLDDTKLDFRVILDNGGLIDTITYYKSEAINGTFNKVSSSRSNVYSEKGIMPGAENHCFKYQVKDICGVLTLPSDPFCTISLHNIKKDSVFWDKLVIPPDISIPSSQPLYHVEYYNEEIGAYELINTMFSDTTLYIGDFIENLDNPVLKLRVLLNQNFPLGGNNDFPLNSYSNTIQYTLDPEIFAPSVFTPNDSGPLETNSFKVFSKFVKAGNYKIMDRFGNLLFESLDLQETWDGTDHKVGKQVAIGTYFYIVSAIGHDNRPVQLKGSLSVLR